MIFLKDFCALIVSGVYLYNGLSANKGMVAIYGKGDVVHSMYNFKTEISARDFVMRRISLNYVRRFTSQDRVVYFCLPQEFQTSDIEEILIGMGFQKSKYKDERKSSDDFMSNELKQMESNNYIVNAHTPQLGRQIAAAVTMGRVSLAGTYDGTYNKNKIGIPKLHMDSPINMGNIRMIFSQEDSTTDQRLVYINSELRIIRKDFNSVLPIFDMNPGLEMPERPDIAKNKKQLNSIELDNFLQRQFYSKTYKVKLDHSLTSLVFLKVCSNNSPSQKVT